MQLNPSPPRSPLKKRESKKGELSAWLERTAPRQIGEPEWETLLGLLAPISESYLRRLLRDHARESGVPLTPLVEGVRQESFEALESSLLRLLAEYEQADAARRTRVRSVVIAAKDHARLAGRNESKRAEKEEMVLWMLTWLENPPVFPEWVRLRQAARGET
jgi:hypothetical protein